MYTHTTVFYVHPHNCILRAPTQLYSTCTHTTVFYVHPHNCILRAPTQLYSTCTTQLYSTCTTQLYSTCTTQLYSTCTTQLYSTCTTQLYSTYTHTTVFYVHPHNCILRKRVGRFIYLTGGVNASDLGQSDS